MMTFREVKVLDINSGIHGVPASMLMENAGRGIARFILEEYSPNSVLIICGPGNNGGDGYVAGRRLSEEGVDVIVLPVREPNTDLATAAAEKADRHVRKIDIDDLDTEVANVDVVVDAMLGVGITGDLREPYARIVELLNLIDQPIVSVDVPTGMGTEGHLVPSVTLTFHDIKQGMDGIGRVEVIDIGIPPKASLFTGPGELTLIPSRRRDGHKGTSGKVLIIGGGPFTGAPALAAMSALRTGCDLAVVAAPARAAGVIAEFSPNIIVRSLPGDMISDESIGPLADMVGGFDSVAIGPGMGDDPASIEATKHIVSNLVDIGKPFAIDADALRIYIDSVPTGIGVMTPHMGEFRRIVGDGKPVELARKLIEDTDMVVLLKGVEDVITSSGRTIRNTTGNPGMTVGGTGDVLAGAVGGLLALGLEPFDAARVAAYVVGAAGDKAYEEYGNSLLATDIIETMPSVLKGSE